MGQRALGADVGFAAEDLVIVDGKLVVEAMRLFARGLDACREQRFGRIELAGVDLEIRVDAYDGSGLAHGGETMVARIPGGRVNNSSGVRTQTGVEIKKLLCGESTIRTVAILTVGASHDGTYMRVYLNLSAEEFRIALRRRRGRRIIMECPCHEHLDTLQHYAKLSITDLKKHTRNATRANAGVETSFPLPLFVSMTIDE